MTIQVVVPSFEKSYPRRRDRLHEEPSAKNAQGLFPPDACLFVGNLSTKVCTDELATDLKKLFTDFGPCHVKIKQDKKKGLPGAFVQFEKVEDASAALVNTDRAMLHDRWLRIERAKGRRTAGLGLRSGAPITPEDLSFALEGRGPVEAYWFEQYPVGPQLWALICKVTFAYVDDCRDAIKHFQKDDKYYLSLLDMDGSPMLPSPGRDYPLQMRGNNSSQMARNNNNARYNNAKVYRNSQNRGGYRGLGWRPSLQHIQPQPQPESQSLPYIRDHFPIPPVWMNGMQYNHDAHQPIYPPPGPHLNSFYGTPTMLVNGQPIFDHLPLPSLPEVYLSPSLGGPFIINSPLQYDGGVPAFDHEACPPYNGFPGVSSGSISQHGGYSWNNQPAYDGQGAYASKLDDRSPPQEQHKTPPPPTICETINGEAAADTGIEKLLELNRPEAPPKLIRVDEFDRSTTPKKKEPLEPVKEEDQDGNETQATELTGDSASMSDSSSSRSSHRHHYRLDKNCNNTQARYSGRESTPSFSRSRSCSRPSSMIEYYVPSSPASDICLATQTTPSKAIGEYGGYQTPAKQALDLSENSKRDVVVSLEAEKEKRQKTGIKKKIAIALNPGSSYHRSRSLTRIWSPKSV